MTILKNFAQPFNAFVRISGLDGQCRLLQSLTEFPFLGGERRKDER